MDGPEGSAPAMAGFPDDPLEEIFSRVPAKSLCRFKCISKAWRDLIADRLRCRKFPQTLAGFFSGSDGANENCGNFTDLLGRSVPLVDASFSFLRNGLLQQRALPHRTQRRLVADRHQRLVILSSHNGLLLIGHILDSGTYRYIVCNPVTEQWVAVPSSDWEVCVLSPPAAKCEDKESEDRKEELHEEGCHDDEEADNNENSDDDESTDYDDDGSEVDDLQQGAHHFLIFDPTVSSRFRLLQFGHYYCDEMVEDVDFYSSKTGVWRCITKDWGSDEVVDDVNYYSSKTGVWRCRTKDWARHVEGDECERWLGGFDEVKSELGSAYVNGMLHILVYYHHRRKHLQRKENQIVVLDIRGKISRIIRWPDRNEFASATFIGQSQGHLYCISGQRKTEDHHAHITGLSIWVLENYDTEHWLLKQSVNFLHLFGKESCNENDYAVVAIHPDKNLVFFVQHWDHKLISYDMDNMEVHSLCTLGKGSRSIIPYVPYFAESSALPNKF